MKCRSLLNIEINGNRYYIYQQKCLMHNLTIDYIYLIVITHYLIHVYIFII